jgi:hypothetical protein
MLRWPRRELVTARADIAAASVVPKAVSVLVLLVLCRRAEPAQERSKS